MNEGTPDNDFFIFLSNHRCDKLNIDLQELIRKIEHDNKSNGMSIGHLSIERNVRI